MDITILKPPDRGNGLLFYDVVNRGWPLIRAYNSIMGIETMARQRGYTVVWSGWQGDVKKSNPLRHTIVVPTASENGKEITGWVWPHVEVTTPTASAPFFAPNFVHSVYEPVDLNASDSRLTRQRGPDDPPTEIPRSDWAFARCDAENPFPGIPSSEHLCLKDGLEPGYAYVVSYRAKNPLVQGLGLAAMRDFVSFLRNDSHDDLGTPNPVYESIRASVMHGMSQSSQVMRTFLHLGFNRDEEGRIVFEGMNLHIAGTRNGLNVRFSLPTLGQAFRLGHLRPGWESPHTWMPEYDSVARRSGWLLERCMETGTCPKIIHTVGSSEYWNSRASLTTTDANGQYDAWIPRNVRMYLFSGTQHVASPPSSGICQQLRNPNNWAPYLRALVVALEQWVLEGTEPPASQIPTLGDGTLVTPDAASIGWPDIPGVKYTGRINALPLVDFGPDFDAEDMTGILGEELAVVPGKAYTVLVSKVDGDGNEVAGIRPTTVQAPVATYTGWNLQRAGFAEDELCQNTGSYIPFATTKAERETAGDPRLSLEERYGTHEGYVQAVGDTANRLVARGFLLPEDAAAAIAAADASDVLVPAENEPPVAVVQPASLTTVVRQVQLDGSKSWDPEGEPLTYSWEVTGNSVVILNADTATPTVQLPPGVREHHFELTVTDPQGASAKATATCLHVGR
jgi:hypothetical protein